MSIGLPLLPEVDIMPCDTLFQQMVVCWIPFSSDVPQRSYVRYCREGSQCSSSTTPSVCIEQVVIRLAAVFGPIPGTPGMLSLVYIVYIK
jgi:hypothetical protein